MAPGYSQGRGYRFALLCLPFSSLFSFTSQNYFIVAPRFIYISVICRSTDSPDIVCDSNGFIAAESLSIFSEHCQRFVHSYDVKFPRDYYCWLQTGPQKKKTDNVYIIIIRYRTNGPVLPSSRDYFQNYLCDGSIGVNLFISIFILICSYDFHPIQFLRIKSIIRYNRLLSLFSRTKKKF